MSATMLLRRTIRPATIAGWLLTAALTPAQETGRPWGFLSPKADLTDKPEAAPPIDVRANVTQPLYLYLVNPTEDTPTVSVVLRTGSGIVGKIASVRLPAKAVKSFVLSESVPATKTPAGLPISIDAKSSQLIFTVAVSNANNPNETANEAMQALNLKNPATLLGETLAKFVGGTNQLTVEVKARDLQGPPCPVELALSPDDVKGLLKGDLQGITRAVLTTGQPNATLVAGGLALAPGSTGEGKATLTVDGVERAVVLKGSFKVQAGATSSPFTIDPVSELRVRAPQYAKPGDAVAAKLEASNISESANITFTVSPGPAGKSVATQTFTRSGPREHSAAVTVNDAGGLNVITVMKDWSFKPETRGLFGPVTFKAVVTSGGEVKEASTVVTFDETPPKDVKFLPGDPKKFPVRSRAFLVATSGADLESQIDKVDFFIGVEPPAPAADGKVPAEPKPIPAKFDDKVNTWSAALPMPEKKGPLPVFVRYTNHVGLSTVVKQNIDVCDPVLGGVKGQVFFGDRAQKMDVTVWLFAKDNKTVVKEAKVNADGVFEMKDIPAGDYTLLSEQRTSAKPITGTATITVKEGPDPTEAKITLKKS